MTKVYGGLLLKNLQPGDVYLELQRQLFNTDLIQGAQILVPHPSFGKDFDFSVLPKGFEVFFHCEAENRGFDPGQNLDEQGTLIGLSVSWEDWNYETLEWCNAVAFRAMVEELMNYNNRYENSIAVAHPGYGEGLDDEIAYRNIVELFNSEGASLFSLETVPPIVDRRFPHCEGEVETWSSDSYWGFGGTPDDMKRLIEETDKICLLDLTHIAVAWNQANTLNMPKLANCKNLERMIKDYWDLPHSRICHFSGIPPKNWLVDSHDFLNAEPHPAIRDAIRQMEAVCLEIPFRPDEPEKTIKEIEAFRDAYLS